MPNTILFDHDGVLVDTEHLYFKATAETIARAGGHLSLRQYQQFHLIESRGSWHLAPDATPEIMARLRRERIERYTELVTTNEVLVPGMIDLLTRLKAHYRMAVVTSSRRVPFEAIHRTSGLFDRIEFALTHEDYARAKPDPEPYLTAVAKLGADIKDCLVVEDTPRGLAAARAAGIECWIIRSDITAGLTFEGASRTFDSLAEVGEALLAGRP